MKESKLIEVVRQLKKPQIVNIHKMLISPFHNTREELTDLFSYLVDNIESFIDDDLLSKKRVFFHIYPDLNFDEKKLAYAQSFLLKIIEEYLVLEELEEREILKSSLLMRKLNQLELSKMFNSTMKRTNKQMSKSPHRNGIFFLDAYLVKRQENDFMYKKDPVTFNNSIKEAVNELDIFYKAERVRYLCAIVNRNIHKSEDFDNTMLKDTLEDILKNDFYNQPVIRIYGSILLGLLEPQNEIHFSNLRELIITYIDNFPQSEVRDHYVYAINYCVRKVNNGQEEYFDEMFKLFKILLSNDVLLEKGKISHHEYLNIVSVAVQQKEFFWAHRFIDDYKKKLEKNIEDTAFNYNKAYLLFAEQDFERAHKTLNKVQFNDVFYALKTKMLLLKLYYEENEFEILKNHADSFRVFVRRNSSIGANRKKLFIDSIANILKLSKLKYTSLKKIENLEVKVLETRMIEKKWLLLKIKEAKLRVY